jgi:hypothetical protein
MDRFPNSLSPAIRPPTWRNSGELAGERETHFHLSFVRNLAATRFFHTRNLTDVQWRPMSSSTEFLQMVTQWPAQSILWIDEVGKND